MQRNAQLSSNKEQSNKILLSFTGINELTDDNKSEIKTEIDHITKQFKEKELTRVDKKVLAIKILPHSSILSITDKCKLLNIGRRSWYKANDKPIIGDLVSKYSKLLLSDYTPDVLRTHANLALLGSESACVKVLEETGVYDKPNANTNIALNVNVEKIETERNASLKTGLEKLGLIEIEAKEK